MMDNRIEDDLHHVNVYLSAQLSHEISVKNELRNVLKKHENSELKTKFSNILENSIEASEEITIRLLSQK